MRNKRNLVLSVMLCGMLFLLSGCSIDYTQPIDANTKFFLIKWVAWIFYFFAGLFDKNFGMGIICTTILVRLAAWPIYSQSNDLSLKMNMMQPDMQKIQAKYATRKDPESQQKMQMEMMRLYKEYKINPLGCIFMQSIQMVIFITMYSVVRRIVIPGGFYSDMNMNLGMWDLTEKNDIILTILVAGTMLVQQIIGQRKPKYIKNYPTAPKNPQQESQQKTMKFMMFFMIFMMASVAWSSNAIALYWVVGNIISIGQVLIGKKLSERKYYKMKGIIKGD